MKDKLKKFAPAAAWLAFILVLTSIPSPGFSVVQVRGADKLLHFLLYLPFGLLLFRALGAVSLKPALACLLLCAAVALCDELHQTLIPGRFFEFFDLAADVAGSGLGMVIYTVIKRRAALRGRRDRNERAVERNTED
ncbi:MAG: VanZ family protein [Pseudomonadota bacterium]